MIEQGTPEWFALRCGKVTASRISDMLAKAKTKGEWGASRANYAAQLVAERLTGTVLESYQSPEMKWGTETEPQARAAYEFYTGAQVEVAEFTLHPHIPMSGASPDGFVGDDGMLEIKCPNTATHIDNLLGATIPGKYLLQMQWQMACANRQWCDFVSFDPRMPESMRMFCKRVPRDAKSIAEIESAVEAFLAEIAETVSRLRARYEPIQEAA